MEFLGRYYIVLKHIPTGILEILTYKRCKVTDCASEISDSPKSNKKIILWNILFKVKEEEGGDKKPTLKLASFAAAKMQVSPTKNQVNS